MAQRARRTWPDPPEPLGWPVIDNHTHLPVEGEEIPVADGVALDVDTQLARATRAGVGGIITCGCELNAFAGTLALTERPGVWAALAVHPNEAAMHAGIREVGPDGLEHEAAPHHEIGLDEAIATVADTAAAHSRVVAIGESGLDYFRTGEAGREAQKRSFAAHIRCAKELDLPLQIHDRDAHADTVEVLKACGAPERTVFHCFSGDAELAEILAANGWYASFAGPVTFRANAHLREAARVLPRELIMVETDAPYLTPHPHRGCPNASYMVTVTLRGLAQARGEDPDALAEATWHTTCDVYGLDPHERLA